MQSLDTFSAHVSYDGATAISLGKRDRQEDCLAADFTAGATLAYAVLSDGMGGHEAGDVASKLVVSVVYSALKRWSGSPDCFDQDMPQVMQHLRSLSA